MSQPDVSVERLTEYSEADAAGIGRLRPFLDEALSGDPVREDLLRKIIDSPEHAQLVARLDGVIVGTATMNLLVGALSDQKGDLEDFVTDPEVQGRGIGDKVWQAMLDWTREQEGKSLTFTSRPSREKAHRFYEKHGAEIRDTTVFQVPLK